MKIEKLFVPFLLFWVLAFSLALAPAWDVIKSREVVVLRDKGPQKGAIECLKKTKVSHFRLPPEGLSAEDVRYIVSTAWPQRVDGKSPFILSHPSHSPSCSNHKILCTSEGVQLAHCVD